MNFVIEKLIEELNNSDLLVKDSPRYFPKSLTNVQDFLSWDTVNECLNNPLYEFEVIGLDGFKIEVPRIKLPWIHHTVKDKQFIAQKISEGYGFIILNYGVYNKTTQILLSEIEQQFNVNCDIHVYGGLGNTAKSFDIHEDATANFIVQSYGKTNWKVSNDRGLSLLSVPNNENNKPSLDNIKFDLDVVLESGDMLYLPARCYHMALPNLDRLSMSIACWPQNNNIPRNYLQIQPE